MLRENLLTLEDDLTVVPSPYIFTVLPFKKIMGTRGMEEAVQTLSYIYFMKDPRSKFAAYTETRRHDEIVSKIFPSGEFEPDEYVNRAMDEYCRHFSSTVLLLGAARESVAKLTTWLEGIDVEHEDYDAYKHVQILEKMGKTVNGLKELEEAAKKESELNDTYGGVIVDRYSE